MHRELKTLRLVSPSWRDAVQQCPWKLQWVHLEAGQTLEGISKALPAMSSLDIECVRTEFIPGAPLSGVPTMHHRHFLDGIQTVEPYVHFRYLPSALQSLSMNGGHFIFAGMSLPHLSNLHISDLQNPVADVMELLTHLPAVRVSLLAKICLVSSCS